MRRWFAQIALLCLLVPAGLAAAPRQSYAGTLQSTTAPDLQPYQSAEGRFSVIFPAGKTQHSAKEIKLKGGASSTLHQTWVELDNSNVAYMVMYNDYPADYVNQAPEDVLAAAHSGAVNGKTVLSDRPISLDGVPGRAFTATDHDGWHYTVHQFLAGERLYQLIVVSDKSHPAADTEEFMNSFQIH